MVVFVIVKLISLIIVDLADFLSMYNYGNNVFTTVFCSYFGLKSGIIQKKVILYK